MLNHRAGSREIKLLGGPKALDSANLVVLLVVAAVAPMTAAHCRIGDDITVPSMRKPMQNITVTAAGMTQTQSPTCHLWEDASENLKSGRPRSRVTKHGAITITTLIA